MKRIAILDTDIGSDIDDTWALGMLINSPKLDTRLVLCGTGDVRYRAALTGKLLTCWDRTDIEVGLGIAKPVRSLGNGQEGWLGGFQPENTACKVREDGIARAIELIDAADQVTLIAIGPMTDIAAILLRRPDLAPKCDLRAMAGSIRKNFFNRDGQIAEYNIREDIPAAQAVFSAPWRSFQIAPLDTCGMLQLTGENYRKIEGSDLPVPRAILENFRIWNETLRMDFFRRKVSSILYDTEAVYLAFDSAFLKMEPMRLQVDDGGFLRPCRNAGEILVASEWLDLDAFYDVLIQRLLRQEPPCPEE